MKVLGLDLSTKSGYAVVEDGKLVDFGLIKVLPVSRHSLEDYNILDRAKEVANGVYNVIAKHNPDVIIIEQTNNGRQRTSQKNLEFIHFAVLDSCYNESGVKDRIRYVDTSQWRSELSIKLSKDQRKHNKLVKNKFARGKVTAKHLAVKWANETFGLSLKLKDNDVADACALAAYGHKNSNKSSTQSLDSALLSN